MTTLREAILGESTPWRPVRRPITETKGVEIMHYIVENSPLKNLRDCHYQLGSCVHKGEYLPHTMDATVVSIGRGGRISLPLPPVEAQGPSHVVHCAELMLQALNTSFPSVVDIPKDSRLEFEDLVNKLQQASDLSKYLQLYFHPFYQPVEERDLFPAAAYRCLISKFDDWEKEYHKYHGENSEASSSNTIRLVRNTKQHPEMMLNSDEGLGITTYNTRKEFWLDIFDFLYHKNYNMDFNGELEHLLNCSEQHYQTYGPPPPPKAKEI